MIPEAYIRGWRENAPWSENAMVEQDLLICRALVAIFGDAFLSEQLAFRGGTALHKLYLRPQRRYSEKYMSFVVDHVPTYKEYVLNMEDKMQDEEFLTDMDTLLHPDMKYNPNESYGIVKERLINRLPGERWE